MPYQFNLLNFDSMMFRMQIRPEREYDFEFSLIFPNLSNIFSLQPEQKASQPQTSSAVPRPHANNNVVPQKESPIIDLLGMDNPSPQQTVVTQNASNEFDLFMQAPSFDAPSQSQVG